MMRIAPNAVWAPRAFYLQNPPDEDLFLTVGLLEQQTRIAVALHKCRYADVWPASIAAANTGFM